MDVCGAGDMGQGSGEITDDRLLMMSPLWSAGSYAELYRCLYEMRTREKALYWHVSHRYLRATRRQTQGCPGCNKATREGTRHTHHDGFRPRRFDRGFIIEERFNPRVDEAKVAQGVTWIVKEHRGPPQLPPELYALLAA